MSELLVCTDDDECKNLSYRHSTVFPNAFHRLASPLLSLKSPHTIWSKAMALLDPNLPPPTPMLHITSERTLQSSTSSELLIAEVDLQTPSLGNTYWSHSVNFIHCLKTWEKPLALLWEKSGKYRNSLDPSNKSNKPSTSPEANVYH